MNSRVRVGSAVWRVALLAALLAGCGGGDGPAIKAYPQTIRFGAAPTLTLGGSATVSATSSSGLAVTYTSATPGNCTVDGATGMVTAVAVAPCIVAADQPGNDEFAPAAQATQSLEVIFDPEQVIRFAGALPLELYGTVVVSATASSGLAVTYSSATPRICSVEPNTGVVTDITAGTCTIAADQPGDSAYHAAAQVTLSLQVSDPGANSNVPGIPTQVAATLGSSSKTVVVSFTGPASGGGGPVTGYTVASTPSGVTATGTASPVSVTCPGSCAGHAFSVRASNRFGDGAPSTTVDVLTKYKVATTFLEPMTQPKNSIFIGSFTLNSTTGRVTNLAGLLSESMTGDQIAYPNDNMNWLPISNQLSSVDDSTLGGQLVTSFMLPVTNTLSANPVFGGTDGWAPGSGLGLYFGFPAANPGNAYVRIFVNPADPTAPLTQRQLDKLAYADCAPGGMMGSTCMTGTTVPGYGTVGSMSGYPAAQVVTKE